jgi:hypothetical protein
MENGKKLKKLKTLDVCFDRNCAYTHINCDKNNGYTLLRILLNQIDNLNIDKVIVISDNYQDFQQINDYSNYTIIFKRIEEINHLDTIKNLNNYNNSVIIDFRGHSLSTEFLYEFRKLQNIYFISCTNYVNTSDYNILIRNTYKVLARSDNSCMHLYIQIDGDVHKIPGPTKDRHFQEFIRKTKDNWNIPKYIKIIHEGNLDIEKKVYIGTFKEPQDPVFLADQYSAQGKFIELEKHYQETITEGKPFKYTSKAIDEAASASHNEVVEFWFKLKNQLKDKLKLKMTEKAFDNACINRDFEILQLWKKYDIKPIFDSAIYLALDKRDSEILQLCYNLNLRLTDDISTYSMSSNTIDISLSQDSDLFVLDWYYKFDSTLFNNSSNIDWLIVTATSYDRLDAIKWVYDNSKYNEEKFSHTICLRTCISNGSLNILSWYRTEIIGDRKELYSYELKNYNFDELFINNYIETIEYIERMAQEFNFKIIISEYGIAEICRRNMCHLLKDEYVADYINKNTFNSAKYYDISSANNRINSLQWVFNHAPKLKRYSFENDSAIFQPLVSAYEYGHFNVLKLFKYRSRERYRKLTIMVLNKLSSDKWTCTIISDFADNGFDLNTTDNHTNKYMKKLQL